MNRTLFKVCVTSVLLLSIIVLIPLVNLANSQLYIPESLPEIIIENDGSINPPTDLIEKQANQYVITNDIIGKYSIIVRCSNIIIDGKNHIIDGNGAGNHAGGIDIDRVTNVTIQNIKITNFFFNGLMIGGSPNCSIINCHFTDNKLGVVVSGSSNCSIINNQFTDNSGVGLDLTESNNVVVTNNKLSNNIIAINLHLSNDNNIFRNEIFEDRAAGFYLSNAQGNIIHKNNVTECITGIAFNHAFGSHPSINYTASNNKIFLNNFVNNSLQVSFQYDIFENFWDNGREGNFWSEYKGSDNNEDGICDTGYVLDENNVDNYPLIACFDINTEGVLSQSGSFPTTIAVASIVTIGIIAVGILAYLKKVRK